MRLRISIRGFVRLSVSPLPFMKNRPKAPKTALKHSSCIQDHYRCIRLGLVFSIRENCKADILLKSVFILFNYSLCALLLALVSSVSVLYTLVLFTLILNVYTLCSILFFSHYYFSVYTLYSLFLLFSLCSLFLYAKFNHLWYLAVYFQFSFLCCYSVVH